MLESSSSETVLITGVTGQDGAFLARILLARGFKVYGSIRRGASPKTARLKEFKILDKIIFIPMEITEFSNVIKVLSDVRPDYLYNLAAQSFVVDSFRHPIMTNRVNYEGVLNILESIRILNLDTKIFQPSTSEMYGDQPGISVTEKTNFNPSNPYGLSKLAAYKAINIYRETYGLWASSGILFNHESELRGREFVTRKITGQLALLKEKDGPPLKMGSLSASRDWGYANDYVDAISRIMNDDQCDDYVIATNKLHSVRDFFSLAAENIGFTPEFEGEGLEEKCFDLKTGKLLCEVKSEFFRERDTKALRGNFSKLQINLGWEPSTTFEQLVEIMSIHDLELEKRS
jgi:GDPmannose 4,6-dehydratase